MDTVGKEFEGATESEAVARPSADEVGAQFEVATEAETEVGPDAESGHSSGSSSGSSSSSSGRTSQNIRLLFLIGSLFLTGAALWGVTRGIKQNIPILASAIASGSGASYTMTLPASGSWLFESLTDSVDSPTRSNTEVFENDQSLGPAHSSHEAIRSEGSGRFSHWGSTLYFSTSDNSEPRINGRHYEAVITATLPAWVLAVAAACLLLALYLNRQMMSLLLGPLASGAVEKIKAQWEMPAEPPLVEATPFRAAWRDNKRAVLAVILPPVISLLLGITLHALVSAQTLVGDARTYHLIATGLIGQNQEAYYGFHWALGGLAMRGLLYPVFIAIIYGLLGGPHPAVVGWIQALVMVPLTTYLIYVAGKEIFSRRVGIIASWAFALWFPAVWYTVWLMTETLLNLMMALVLALLAATLARKSAKLGLLCGVAMGLLSVGHAAYQLLPIVMVPALLIHLYFYGRRHIWLAVFVVIGILSIHLPYRIVVIAEDLPSLGQGGKGYGGGGGWGFYIASRAETNFIPIRDDYHYADLTAPGQLAEVGQKIDRGEIRVEPHLLKIIRAKLALPEIQNQVLTDGDFYRAGIQNLLDHPDQWPIKLRQNITELFVLPNELQFYKPEPTPATWFRKPWQVVSKSLFACLLLSFLFVFWKRRDRLLLFVPFVFQSAVFIVVIAEWRYIIPFWSSMFLLTAAGMVGWLESLSAVRSARLERRSLPERSSS